ncbi:MAG: Lrp/AsnC family transcriptional regulator [Hyphomicrobiaceae bacterium]|nr:Lrp/AsnC family transcriptional regulator [Hyphomicrobiaceae bacterium]
MKHKFQLDDIDWQILGELQKDGRITNVELAKRIGISAPPCLRRVRTLEKKGYIDGFHATLDQKLLGLGVTAFAMVGLTSQAESDLQAFSNQISQMPQVTECYMLSGEIDFILKCTTTDLASFQDFIINGLTAIPNVDSVKTSLAIKRCKSNSGIDLQAAKTFSTG